MAGLISHDRGGDSDLAAAVAAATARIEAAGPQYGDRAQLLSDLDTWQQCDLGRWMLQHGGWNAYWTRYCISYGAPGAATTSNPVEEFFLTRAPAIVATRQRSRIFAGILASLVTPGSTALSVPCGLMDDLLRLPDAPRAGLLIGVDLDAEAITEAADNATDTAPLAPVVLAVGDAWRLDTADVVVGQPERFRETMDGGVDVVTSNGLNIYVADESAVVALYRSLRATLRPGGTLVVSALTPPSEWDMTGVDPADLIRARGLMLINDVMWANYRPAGVTEAQLHAAGFEAVEVHHDERRVFPTFVARAGQ